MIHIANNIWLDADQYSFCVMEEATVQDFRTDKDGNQIANKGAGEKKFINQTYHARHTDVINELMDRGLKQGINNDYFGFMELIEGTKKQFQAILKLQRK